MFVTNFQHQYLLDVFFDNFYSRHTYILIPNILFFFITIHHQFVSGSGIHLLYFSCCFLLDGICRDHCFQGHKSKGCAGCSAKNAEKKSAGSLRGKWHFTSGSCLLFLNWLFQDNHTVVCVGLCSQSKCRLGLYRKWRQRQWQCWKESRRRRDCHRVRHTHTPWDSNHSDISFYWPWQPMSWIDGLSLKLLCSVKLYRALL